MFLRQKKLYSTLSVKNEHFISRPRGSNSKTYRVSYFAPTFSKNIVLHTPCLGIPPQFRYVSRKRSIVDLKMRKRIVSPLHFSIIHPSLFYFISTRKNSRLKYSSFFENVPFRSSRMYDNNNNNNSTGENTYILHISRYYIFVNGEK